jgi:hypothetical protein
VQNNKEQEVLNKATISCIKILTEYENQSEFGVPLWSEYQICRSDHIMDSGFAYLGELFPMSTYKPTGDVFHNCKKIYVEK